MFKLVLNWKMSRPNSDFKNYIKDLEHLVKNKKMNVILSPNYIDMDYIGRRINKVKLSAQNISQYNEGPYTGEVSANFLKDKGVEYAIVGHSERRRLFNESSHSISKKAITSLNNNIIPIICIGEYEEDYKKGLSSKILREEIDLIKKDLKDNLDEVIFAYEPIWAVGNELVFTDKEYQHIEKMLNIIKSETKNNKIIYGGSVNESNVERLMSINAIKGFLVGGVSLDIKKLYKISDKIKGKINGN